MKGPKGPDGGERPARPRPELWRAVAGEWLVWRKPWVSSRRFEIVDCGFFDVVCWFRLKCFFFCRENLWGSTGFLQLYSQSNVRAGTRRMPKVNDVSRSDSLEKGRGRTHSHPMWEGGGRGQVILYSYWIIRYPIATMPVASRSRGRMMMMTIVTENKSAEFCVNRNRGH